MKVRLWSPLSRSCTSSLPRHRLLAYYPYTSYLFSTCVLELVPQFVAPSQKESYTKECELQFIRIWWSTKLSSSFVTGGLQFYTNSGPAIRIYNKKREASYIGETTMAKLDAPFPLWFSLVCSISPYCKCPCMGEWSPVTSRRWNKFT